MKLKVLLPTRILVDQEVTKVTAEAENGSFTVLPRHIDFVASLVPGLLSYEARSGGEEFLALDEGVFVKRGEEVLVSTLNAVHDNNLGKLETILEEQFQDMDEQSRKARTAVARLETDFMRRFLELQ